MQFQWISVNTCLLVPEVLRYQNNNNANYDVFQYYITGQIKVYWKEWTTRNASHWMDCDVMYVIKLLGRRHS